MTDGEVVHIAGQIEPPADFDAIFIVVARDGRRRTFADATQARVFLWGKTERDWRVFRRIRLTGGDLRKILETEGDD